METINIALAVSDAYRAEKLANERGVSLENLICLLLSKEVIITSASPESAQS